MWEWFKSRDRSDRLLIIFGALFAIMILSQTLSSANRPNDSKSRVDSSIPRTYASGADRSAGGYASSSVLPTAEVDGVTYSGQEQIDAMTQAARDAGMDEATARRTGEEAAVLCNGNPDCLR